MFSWFRSNSDKLILEELRRVELQLSIVHGFVDSLTKHLMNTQSEVRNLTEEIYELKHCSNYNKDKKN
jgi:ribosomal protein S15P/S13E